MGEAGPTRRTDCLNSGYNSPHLKRRGGHWLRATQPLPGQAAGGGCLSLPLAMLHPACFLWVRIWNLNVGVSVVSEILWVILRSASINLLQSERPQKQESVGRPQLWGCEALGTSTRLIKGRARAQWSLEPGMPDNQSALMSSKFRTGQPPGPTLRACLFLSRVDFFDFLFPSGTAIITAVITPLEMLLNSCPAPSDPPPEGPRRTTHGGGGQASSAYHVSLGKFVISTHIHTTRAHTLSAHTCTPRSPHPTPNNSDWPFVALPTVTPHEAGWGFASMSQEPGGSGGKQLLGRFHWKGHSSLLQMC